MIDTEEEEMKQEQEMEDMGIKIEQVDELSEKEMDDLNNDLLSHILEDGKKEKPR